MCPSAQSGVFWRNRYAQGELLGTKGQIWPQRPGNKMKRNKQNVPQSKQRGEAKVLSWEVCLDSHALCSWRESPSSSPCIPLMTSWAQAVRPSSGCSLSLESPLGERLRLPPAHTSSRVGACPQGPSKPWHSSAPDSCVPTEREFLEVGDLTLGTRCGSDSEPPRPASPSPFPRR